MSALNSIELAASLMHPHSAQGAIATAHGTEAGARTEIDRIARSGVEQDVAALGVTILAAMRDHSFATMPATESAIPVYEHAPGTAAAESPAPSIGATSTAEARTPATAASPQPGTASTQIQDAVVQRAAP